MPTRRRVLRRGLAAGGAAVLAGCGESGTDDPVPGFDPEGRTLTVLALGTGERQQLNPYSLNQQGVTLVDPFQQLVLPADASTGRYLPSGHSWTVDGEEVSVPCAVADYEVDADGVTTTFESGFTYWNGDPLGAEAYALADRLDLFAFGEFGEEFPNELVGDGSYRRRVEADDWDDMWRAIHPGDPPLPPSFTRQWVERFEGASTRTANDDVYAELSDVTIGRETFVEEGFGSGAYRVESTDEMTGAALGARRRDDHPGDVAVPNLLVLTPRGDGSTEVGDGDVDVGTGHVGGNGADYQRDSVPERVQQVSRYPSPVEGGVQLLFNWSRGDLRRLWVRRALAAALPGDRFAGNAYGAGGRAIDQHSGLLSGVARATLGRDWVDGLYEYPVERDDETASEWLRSAGYSRQDGEWLDPDGEALSLTLVTGQRTTPLEESVAGALSEFGVTIDVETYQVQPQDQFTPTIREGEWDVLVGEAPAGLNAADLYATGTRFAASRLSQTPGVYASPLSVGGAVLGVCETGTEWISPPETATVPAEPGTLRIEGVEYADGGTAYRHDAGVDVDVCAAVETVLSVDATDDERREAARRCARWYNYALPTFVFAQAREGLWGDTESLAYPESQRGRRIARPPTWSPTQYHVQAGTVR